MSKKRTQKPCQRRFFHYLRKNMMEKPSAALAVVSIYYTQPCLIRGQANKPFDLAGLTEAALPHPRNSVRATSVRIVVAHR